MSTSAIVFAAIWSISGNTAANPPAQASRQPFEQKIPGTVVSIPMVPIPDGSSTLNGTKTEIKALWMSATEITWDVYDVFAFKLDLPEEQRIDVDTRARPTKPYGAPDRGFGHAGYPAIGMTWEAARIFCGWLSEKTGKRYRLPTEAEWDYAARAGANSEPPSLGEIAWYWDNADDATHAVGKKKPNAWGLHDMLGNVGEWIVGPPRSRMLAGGTFIDKAKNVGFGTRKSQEPSWQVTDPQMPKSKWWLTDAPFAGFRVVCEG